MDKVDYYKTPSCTFNLIEGHYQNFAFQRHYHLDFHLGLITHGQQKFQHKGTQHHVGQGQMIIMPPDEIHDGESIHDQTYQTTVLSFDPNALSDLADLSKNGQIISFNQLIVSDRAVFSQIFNLCGLLKAQTISQLAKDCLPLEGLDQLFTRYGSIQPMRSAPLGIQTIESIKEYLLAHLDQAVTLTELAQLCELSPTQFQRRFKVSTGLTPYAWFARLRLEQAMVLLKQGLSGTEVAHQIGFYDQAHFSKAFKRAYGVSPSQIR